MRWTGILNPHGHRAFERRFLLALARTPCLGLMPFLSLPQSFSGEEGGSRPPSPTVYKGFYFPLTLGNPERAVVGGLLPPAEGATQNSGFTGLPKALCDCIWAKKIEGFSSPRAQPAWKLFSSQQKDSLSSPGSGFTKPESQAGGKKAGLAERTQTTCSEPYLWVATLWLGGVWDLMWMGDLI